MVHSATMSDVHLDLLDWNVHNLQSVPPAPIVHSNNSENNDNLNSVEDNNHVVDGIEDQTSSLEDSALVQNSYSMFTIISTPKMKGGEIFLTFIANNPTLT